MTAYYDRPIFAVSDLHMGDGGPRDNFAYGDREKEFLGFLDHVESQNGELVICGDLFELWQANMSRVLTWRRALMDRLAKMGATYILGNHDVDLWYFINTGLLNHPLLSTMRAYYVTHRGGRGFYFCHGHEADPYCASKNPGLGRITAIYSGLKEDKNGGPMLNKYRTVEDRVVGRMERWVSFWNRLRGKPDRFVSINRNLKLMIPNEAIVICGHTHLPGRIDDWHYNCGTWAERRNSFVQIDAAGRIGVYDWVGGSPQENRTELRI